MVLIYMYLYGIWYVIRLSWFISGIYLETEGT